MIVPIIIRRCRLKTNRGGSICLRNAVLFVEHLNGGEFVEGECKCID